MLMKMNKQEEIMECLKCKSKNIEQCSNGNELHSLCLDCKHSWFEVVDDWNSKENDNYTVREARKYIKKSKHGFNVTQSGVVWLTKEQSSNIHWTTYRDEMLNYEHIKFQPTESLEEIRKSHGDEDNNIRILIFMLVIVIITLQILGK